ncbi:hypothetical protein L4X63_11915 [Geomonas sp. Red32]|uniref:hypothetical protein n=1 Tax=Geomonas sp. Red32 TaxID=2912856 RepID=UPI00202CD322|nr:hypothetical protein [Geomonas sp. Red32]MCM0082296.1 hypothetical protein [Geomonas sp. Red32]
MLAVEKWAQGKSQYIALFAPSIAAFAREIPDILKYQKKHRLLSHTFSVPDLPSWSALYRFHHRYTDPLYGMIFQTSEYGQRLITLMSEFQRLSRNPDLLKEMVFTSEEIKEGQTYWNELQRMSFDDIQEDISGAPMTPEMRTSFQQYMDANETEFAFLFLVAIPCLLIYKEWPSSLYRKAVVRGDTGAIHKLLRLDPFTLHDSAIGKQIQHVRIHGRQAVYEELLSAPLKPLKVKLTSRTIKDMLAGFISLLAEKLKQPLTSTEIRDLFDAVAKDTDKRDIDTSLPESQEAYSKVIQLNRPDWEPMLRPGQKKLK